MTPGSDPGRRATRNLGQNGRKRAPLSGKHKEAMSQGREEGRIVSRYLQALEEHRARRGRPRTRDSVQRQLEAIEKRLYNATALQRLHLQQERKNLLAIVDNENRKADVMPKLEAEFVKVARSYSDRKKIDYSTWRDQGVPPAVLARAGITTGRKKRS